MHGDIDGYVGWTITRHPNGTAVQFDQAVTLEQPAIRKVDVAIRPLLQWNHAVAMRGCAKGLQRRLAAENAA